MTLRMKIFIRGIVQGVGFRPFVYRLANDMNIAGTICNTISGVTIEAEGEKEQLDNFLIRIRNEKPPLAFIHGMEFSWLDAAGMRDFKINESTASGNPESYILPDIAICDDCLKELFDPGNRRFHYPFINCTNCGPRFSIIESLPYDRQNTSMKIFEMCADCRNEYENPSDRRFHAQPVACFVCGPEVKLLTSSGEFISGRDDAVSGTVELIKKGKIIALKGLGGYQLIADALNEEAVKNLRQRKNRETKPFAVMTKDISMSEEFCEINELEKRLLCSPESPVVLLKKKKGKSEFNSAAPGNPFLGVMHPYTPLHNLILCGINSPVIATSGNISEEPMCINEKEAFEKLHVIADYFLIHNRGIVRAVDDSVARVVKGREMIIRRARGYAPLPFPSGEKSLKYIALGANLKSTISLKAGENIIVSQHLGDLENKETHDYLIRTINDLKQIYKVEPDYLIHDLHPGLATTTMAKESDKDTIAVQHHYAHAAACYFENHVSGSCIAVCWDGTGFGSDGTIWGGEFLLFNGKEFKHAAQLKQFRIPGGGKAIQDIKRAAAGILYNIYGEKTLRKLKFFGFLPDAENIRTFIPLLEKNINCFVTSSAGRLIDGVSFLLRASAYSHFEGESAMQLEFLAAPEIKESYPFNISKEKFLTIDWHPVIEKIISDLRDGIAAEIIAAKFHNTLVSIIAAVSMIINEKKILLTGGCFQNMYLLNKAIDKLKEKNFIPYWHQRIPTNDGGISFGQAAYASVILENKNR